MIRGLYSNVSSDINFRVMAYTVAAKAANSPLTGDIDNVFVNVHLAYRLRGKRASRRVSLAQYQSANFLVEKWRVSGWLLAGCNA